MAFFNAGAAAAPAAYKCDAKDVDITAPPNDSVACLAWSPVAHHLVSCSWDNEVRVWEVQPMTGASQPKLATQAEAPPLSACFSPSGDSVYYGGCDNKAFVWNLATQQKTQVGAHTAPLLQQRGGDDAPPRTCGAVRAAPLPVSKRFELLVMSC